MCDKEIASLVNKKLKIKAGPGASGDKKKKAKVVKSKLKNACRMLETLESIQEFSKTIYVLKC